jgi:hypothetical protein
MINAAIVIQRRMRGILARKRTRARKRQLEVLKVDANGEGSVMHRLEVRAAIKIQARARGMLQRKRMREKALLEQGAKVEDKVKPAGEKPDPKSSKSKKAAEEESHVAKGKSAPKASAKPAVGKDQKKPHADGKVAAPDNGGAAAPAPAAQNLTEQATPGHRLRRHVGGMTGGGGCRARAFARERGA